MSDYYDWNRPRPDDEEEKQQEYPEKLQICASRLGL